MTKNEFNKFKERAEKLLEYQDDNNLKRCVLIGMVTTGDKSFTAKQLDELFNLAFK